MTALRVAGRLLFYLVASRARMAAENLALRQQLVVYKRKRPRPSLRNRDRLFWALLSRIWPNWRTALLVVKPDTVIRWQKRRFREFWYRKCRDGRRGRPRIRRYHVQYIRRISGEPASLRPAVGATKAKPSRVRGRPHRPRTGAEIRPVLSEELLRRVEGDQALDGDSPQVHGQAHPPAGRLHDLAHLPQEPACGEPRRTSRCHLDMRLLRPAHRPLHGTLSLRHHGTGQPQGGSHQRDGAPDPGLGQDRQVRDATFDTEPKFLIHDNDGIFGADHGDFWSGKIPLLLPSFRGITLSFAIWLQGLFPGTPRRHWLSGRVGPDGPCGG